MKAVVFKGKDHLALEEVPKPVARAGQAIIRITTTTICGTDVHIVRGEYPVAPGRILGHEPVGVIDELGEGLDDVYHVGQRVIVGAITPCDQCFYCLNGSHSQCGGALGGWKFGNTINGAWAEYLLVPDARANLVLIPDSLEDEDVMLCPDIFSTGLSGAESSHIRVGDSVAVFAQGPIGLCAHARAGLSRVLAFISGKLVAPYEALYAGLGDQKIVTTLCPGGKERMRRLMAMIEHRRVDLRTLVTHHFSLENILEAYDLFSHQRDGVRKVALHPSTVAGEDRMAAATTVDELC